MFRYLKQFANARHILFKNSILMEHQFAHIAYSYKSGNIVLRSQSSISISDEIQSFTNKFPMEPLPEQQDTNKKVSTFAVLDFETTGLPIGNKVAVTELSIYAFSAKKLEKSVDNTDTTRELNENGNDSLPDLPRVLHKLTLLFNPRLMIHPGAEKITGLNNFMLEDESWFDENAACTIKCFIQHLLQPVCLVAHNGYNFDFPLLKQALDRVKISLPEETLCLDSFWAFYEIDKLRLMNNISAIEEDQAKEIENVANLLDTSDVLIENEETVELISIKDDDTILTDFETEFSSTRAMTPTNALLENENIDWQAINEKTPKRSIKVSENSKTKVQNVVDSILGETVTITNGRTIAQKSRRSLFKNFEEVSNTGKVGKKWPPKGKYKLPEIFLRIFKQQPNQSHVAEADVDTLTKLMQYYGEDFLEYASRFAKPFAEVQRMGAKCKWT